MKTPLSTWLMSEREIKLCKYCAVLHLAFGFVAGLAAVLLWNWRPLYAPAAVIGVLAVSVYVWEKIAGRLVRL